MTLAGLAPSGHPEPASPLTFRAGAFHPASRDRHGTKLGRPSIVSFPFWEGGWVADARVLCFRPQVRGL